MREGGVCRRPSFPVDLNDKARAEVVFEHQGSTFKRTGGGTNNPNEQVSFLKNWIDASDMGNPRKGTVVQEKTAVVFTPAGFLFSGKVVLNQVDSGLVEDQSILGNTRFTADGTSAQLGPKYRVEQDGTALTVTRTEGMMGNSESCRYVRTALGCWFTTPGGATWEVQRQGKVVTVLKNGILSATYQLSDPGT